MKLFIKKIEKFDLQNKIAVIGDSHSRSFSYNKNFVPFFLEEGKKNNFINKQNFKFVKKKTLKLLNSIKCNKTILFFGEPDSRYLQGKGWYPWEVQKAEEVDITKGIEESTDRYIKLINSVSRRVDEVIVMNVIVTAYSEQNKITKEYNECLKNKLRGTDVHFIEINKMLLNDKNEIKDEYKGDQLV